MPTFREVNTGQVVDVSEERAAWFRARARWQPAGGERPEKSAAPAPKAEEQDAPKEREETTTAPKVDAPVKPDADADRDDWLEYARAMGKTDADLKGTRTTTIIGWFE